MADNNNPAFAPVLCHRREDPDISRCIVRNYRRNRLHQGGGNSFPGFSNPLTRGNRRLNSALDFFWLPPWFHHWPASVRNAAWQGVFSRS